MDTNGSGPRVLDRTFAILRLFTPDAPDWTVTEAAEALDLPVPTVHRLLAALQRHGYVARDDVTKRYRLGVAAFELGKRATASTDLQATSLKVLESIAAESGETVLLTAISPDRRTSVCLERVESRKPLRLSVVPGLRVPLHAGASQKALLAYMSNADLHAFIDGGLPTLCDATITDPTLLERELRNIRRRGWATSYQETNLGLWGIAITLLDSRTNPVAALGLAGPRARLPKSRIPEVLRVLDEGARTIAAHRALTTSTQMPSPGSSPPIPSTVRSRPRQKEKSR
ncbi:MAG: IclR family transcriptional regulator [bacterium]|nr:IclR family transcriptional regulator [bacterium]